MIKMLAVGRKVLFKGENDEKANLMTLNSKNAIEVSETTLAA